MICTLVLYDGKMSSAERIAEQLCYMIGHAKAAEIDEAPEELSGYGGICLVFNFYGPVTTGKTRRFLEENRERLGSRRLAMVGIGFSDMGFSKYVVDMEREMGLADISSVFISNETEITRAGYEIGKVMRQSARAMEEDALLDAVHTYIDAHGYLALATAGDGYIRCTPLPYLFHDELFYIVTDGGTKFRGILDNGRICGAIFDTSSDFTDRNPHLQFTGDAEAVPPGTAEYRTVMEERGYTEAILSTLPMTMFLIRLTPFQYEFYDPALEAEGFDASQSMHTVHERKNREDGKEFVTREQLKGQPFSTVIGEDGQEHQVPIPAVGPESIPGFAAEARRFRAAAGAAGDAAGSGDSRAYAEYGEEQETADAGRGETAPGRETEDLEPSGREDSGEAPGAEPRMKAARGADGEAAGDAEAMRQKRAAILKRKAELKDSRERMRLEEEQALMSVVHGSSYADQGASLPSAGTPGDPLRRYSHFTDAVEKPNGMYTFLPEGRTDEEQTPRRRERGGMDEEQTPRRRERGGTDEEQTPRRRERTRTRAAERRQEEKPERESGKRQKEKPVKKQKGRTGGLMSRLGSLFLLEDVDNE